MTHVATSEAWPDRMIEVLNDQHSIVDQLAALADRQSELIESNRTDALLTLLSARQQLIDRFAASQQALSELSAEAGEHAPAIDAGQRASMRELVETITTRLAAVLRIDEQDQQRLETSKQSVQAELKVIGRAAQARQAYGGAADGANRFADQRG